MYIWNKLISYLTKLLDTLLDECLVMKWPGILDLFCTEHTILTVA